ncbi:MAG: inositol monophosphatase family protein [Candidatus Spechtbacterales bacterium]
MTMEYATIAIEAAKAGGVVAEHYFETALVKREKDDTSIVTRADEESERAIIEVLKKHTPDFSIAGEEGGEVVGSQPYRWHVDPIDGTSNFANSIPLFAVSVGLEKDGELIAGVVYNPVIPSLFYAEKGQGAFWNDGIPLHVSSQRASEGMVTYGRSRKPEDREPSEVLRAELSRSAKSARVFGCCALELAYVARGGTEGFVCLGLSTWDYAAGVLLVQEAGGRVSDLSGNPWEFGNGYFLASNGVVHNDIVAITKKLYT